MAEERQLVSGDKFFALNQKIYVSILLVQALHKTKNSDGDSACLALDRPSNSIRTFCRSLFEFDRSETF